MNKKYLEKRAAHPVCINSTPQHIYSQSVQRVNVIRRNPFPRMRSDSDALNTTLRYRNFIEINIIQSYMMYISTSELNKFIFQKVIIVAFSERDYNKKLSVVFCNISARFL